MEASNQIYSLEAFYNDDSDSINQILESKDQMMDALGINQHHDAITGTGVQAVANDYALRLFEAMESNKYTYSQVIGDKVGLEGLVQCFASNSTYLDCPIANYAQDEDYKMNVVVHNPSTVDMTSARIAVPHGHFDVMQGEKKLSAYVVCHDDSVENGQDYESCFMTVDIATAAWDISSFQLQFNADANLVIKQEKLQKGAAMESDAVKITMHSQEESGFTFIHLDKKSGVEKKLSLGLQYWSSWVTPDNWNNG